jgi:hypothetical protein
MARAQAGGGPPGGQPWTARALALDPKMRVLVGGGALRFAEQLRGNRELQKRWSPRSRGSSGSAAMPAAT